MAQKLLVVDDEPNMCRTLEIVLGEVGRREVISARSGEEALKLLDERTGVVLCDLSMPGMDGLEVLRRVRERDPEVQVILMTAYSTVQSAIEAMKLGAFEYLIKPFTDEELTAAVDAALGRARPGRRLRRLRAGAPDRLGEMLGRSEPMKRLFHVVERTADTDATVLITGESGTGKELVARALHDLSRRRAAPFIAVNCAALAEPLLESELFGHERGAFTGAIKTKVGRLEQADGGTILLDEIGEMSPGLQTKLLRALEEREFHRVGGTEVLRVDLRVIAATNRDLPKAIALGLFREDLYYRLNVVTIRTPPLRERMEDLPLLAELFLVEKCADLGVPPKRFAPEALDLLAAHAFPGNVRELENLIERTAVLCDGDVVRPDDLPPGIAGRPLPRLQLETLVSGSLKGGWVTLQAVVKDLERQLVEKAVAAHPEMPNEEIAHLLGTSRRVLELRLAEFGIGKKYRG
ncbi:MAG: sigma-54-dependent Fis family transcriptional regulator [Myxococcales bacterium]|nr:sigma-54-dependent Fis family transcriptional regulator [Myxococcales bacterium]